MHTSSSVLLAATPLDAANHRQATQGHHPPHYGSCHDPIYAVPPPEEPPPSYDDAIHSTTSPLLVGPAPDYGAFRAYVDPDESSEASSEVEEAEHSLSDRVNQCFAMLVLVVNLYIIWRLINMPGT